MAKRATVEPVKRKAKAESTDLSSQLVSLINKSGDFASLMDDEDLLAPVKEWIKTDIPGFDYAVSMGKGIPVGRTILLYGGEGSSKTSVCCLLAKKFQDVGGVTVYLDFETPAVDTRHLKNYGVESKSFVYVTPDYAEDGYNTMWTVLEAQTRKIDAGEETGPMLIVWDSMANACPRDIYAADAEDKFVGALARVNAQELSKLPKRLSRARATLIIINQVSTKISIGPSYGGDNENLPGGRKQRFVSSQIVKLARVKTLTRKVGDRTVTYGMVAKAQSKFKGRFAPIGTSGEYVVLFGDSKNSGCNRAQSLLHTLKQFKLVKIAGQTISLCPALGIDGTVKKTEWTAFSEENWGTIMDVLNEKFNSDTIYNPEIENEEGEE